MTLLILAIIILICVLIWHIGNVIFYNSLYDEDKEKINELDFSLSQINKSSYKKISQNGKYAKYKQIYNIMINLVKDEEIIYFTIGKTKQIVNNKNEIRDAYIFVTNKKVLIINNLINKSIQLEKISSIDFGKNNFTINDSSTSINVYNINNSDSALLKNKIDEQMELHKSIDINITKTTQRDVTDKIARLKSLYEDGVLTEYEFNMKKLELLDKSN